MKVSGVTHKMPNNYDKNDMEEALYGKPFQSEFHKIHKDIDDVLNRIKIIEDKRPKTSSGQIEDTDEDLSCNLLAKNFSLEREDHYDADMG